MVGLATLCGGNPDDKSRVAFRLFDEDGDGNLSEEELAAYVESILRLAYFHSSHHDDAEGDFAEAQHELVAVAHCTAEQCIADKGDGTDKITYEDFHAWFGIHGSSHQPGDAGESIGLCGSGDRGGDVDIAIRNGYIRSVTDKGNSAAVNAATAQDRDSAFDKALRTPLSTSTAKLTIPHYRDLTIASNNVEAKGEAAAAAAGSSDGFGGSFDVTECIHLCGLSSLTTDDMLGLFAATVDDDREFIGRAAYDTCMQQAAVISPSSFSEKELERARLFRSRLFEVFDRRGDGLAHRAQVISSLLMISGGAAEEEQKVRGMFDLFDSDSDGYLTKEEFVMHLEGVFLFAFGFDQGIAEAGLTPSGASDIARRTAEECFASSPTAELLSYQTFRKWCTWHDFCTTESQQLNGQADDPQSPLEALREPPAPDAHLGKRPASKESADTFSEKELSALWNNGAGTFL